MLNMHYLPLGLRANVMDQLYQYVSGDPDNPQDSDKLDMMPIPYKILNSLFICKKKIFI